MEYQIFFLDKQKEKLFLFFLLRRKKELHIEFGLIWTTAWLNKKSDFSKIIIRNKRNGHFRTVWTLKHENPVNKTKSGEHTKV